MTDELQSSPFILPFYLGSFFLWRTLCLNTSERLKYLLEKLKPWKVLQLLVQPTREKSDYTLIEQFIYSKKQLNYKIEVYLKSRVLKTINLFFIGIDITKIDLIWTIKIRDFDIFILFFLS